MSLIVTTTSGCAFITDDLWMGRLRGAAPPKQPELRNWRKSGWIHAARTTASDLPPEQLETEINFRIISESESRLQKLTCLLKCLKAQNLKNFLRRKINMAVQMRQIIDNRQKNSLLRTFRASRAMEGKIRLQPMLLRCSG